VKRLFVTNAKGTFMGMCESGMLTGSSPRGEDLSSREHTCNIRVKVL
jgi:hypothetical protein